MKTIFNKNTLFQLVAGVGLYFLFFRKPTKKLPTVEVGDLVSDGVMYVAKWFTYAEYFGTKQVPADYEKNWWVLSRQLDKIRDEFGSPILITKGFEDFVFAPANKFGSCEAVHIKAQNGKNSELWNIVQNMKNQGLAVGEIQQLKNKDILITI